MSTVPATLAARPVTLEQLAALSDEIGALTRAGVPLDRGLRALATDMPGQLGRLADQIGHRLQEGRSLEQVVEELGTSLPPAYRAVVVAGLRAGNLPAAMQDISRTARRISVLRSSIYLALVYPLIVLVLTWVLGAVVLFKVGPVLAEMLREFDVAPLWMIDVYERVARNMNWIGFAVPLVFVAWLLWSWYRSGRIAKGLELRPWLSFGAVGTLASIQRASRLASLSDLLSLMVGRSVPLPDAVELASSAVGSPAIARGGQKLVEQLRRGQIIQQPPAGFPPLLAWTITGGQYGQELSSTLARTASIYRDEVARRSQWLSLYVSLIMVLFVCGGAVVVYGLLTLGPWIMLMRRLTLPY
jgi:general secretion pathway protein F